MMTTTTEITLDQIADKIRNSPHVPKALKTRALNDLRDGDPQYLYDIYREVNEQEERKQDQARAQEANKNPDGPVKHSASSISDILGR